MSERESTEPGLPEPSQTPAGRVSRRQRSDRAWDGYMALIATFTALLALVVAAYTANLQRKQVQAQVWPRVELSRSNGRALTVTNVGVGPARLVAVKLDLDGRPIKTWDELMHAFGHKNGYGGSQLSKRVLAPGQRLDAFKVWDDETSRLAFKHVFMDNDKRLGITICYCSVLDQCWVERSLKYWRDDEWEGGVAVDECPIAKADQFRE
jgi:hypothetical protein